MIESKPKACALGFESSASSIQAPVVNALTVDVEDWVQSVLDNDLPPTDHFVRNTHRVLDLFDRHDVRGTFFVLGLAAEKDPHLVRAILSAGHEVQSHGYGHRLLFDLSPQEIADDLTRSKKLLEDITGQRVFAYRAPAFSIARANPWVLDLLIECGYEIDASIVPARTRRYGIAGAPWYPHRLRTPGGSTIIEVPVATGTILGRRVPMGGGGYLRLLPARMIARAIRTINRAGAPATIYMHPYEFNPGELSSIPHDVPWRLRMHQGLGRGRFESRVAHLLSTLRFVTLSEALRTSPVPLHDPQWQVRTADRSSILYQPQRVGESPIASVARTQTPFDAPLLPQRET